LDQETVVFLFVKILLIESFKNIGELILGDLPLASIHCPKAVELFELRVVEVFEDFNVFFEVCSRDLLVLLFAHVYKKHSL